jgi:hypothetical protein
MNADRVAVAFVALDDAGASVGTTFPHVMRTAGLQARSLSLLGARNSSCALLCQQHMSATGVARSQP